MSELFEKSRLQISGTRRQLPLSDPQLPRPLLERFREESPDSIIFTPFFSDIRHLMLIEGPTPEITGAIPAHFKVLLQALSGDVDVDCGLSYLHLAVLTGDLPLAYESLRLGTSVNCTDKFGVSPLWYGCDALVQVTRRYGVLVQAMQRYDSISSPGQRHAELQEYMRKMCRVCLFFIAHHSDPNETHKADISVLALACSMRSWELIRALLLHGAIPRGLSQIFHNHPADKARFENLVSELSTAVRPSRICPCGSERPLTDCQQKPQPYLAHYLCPCESRKIHAVCCAKKTDISWEKYWNEEKGWLDLKCTVLRSAQATNPDLGESDLLHAMHVMGVPGVLSSESGRENFGRLDKPNETILKVLAEKRRIDPAYAATCRKTMIAPSPAAIRTVPKSAWIKSMKAWNNAVDAYISSKVDQRAPEIIETAAKIGLAGGPLRCKCEAAGCARRENGDSDKEFPRCSGCKTTIYCSHSCQKSAWKAHKSACRAGNVESQMLPSQEAYVAELARITGFRFAKFS